MENQSKFLEMLQEITQIARAQQNKMTKEEIKQYLGKQDFSEQQMQAIYHYLGENQIKVEGYDFVPDSVQKEQAVEDTAVESAQDSGAVSGCEGKEKVSADKKAETRRERNMKLYCEEVERIGGDLEGEEELVLGFLQGDEALKNRIVERQLQRVVELAQKYKGRNVLLEEVIAEGNVGLLTAVQIVRENGAEYLLADGKPDFAKLLGTLELEIVAAMERYIDETTAQKDWESTVLAKTNLLHEAAKYMTEEMGRVPTIEELSEYTKIARDEIKDIMGLSEDASRVAKPE
jgi:RNA polymerase primary sigma factor